MTVYIWLNKTDLKKKQFIQDTNTLPQHMDIVTLMPRLPLSENNWAMEVSNTKQSEFMIAD